MTSTNEKKIAITFVLPGEGSVPIGGFKVVYEYANALVRRGHRVTVLHPDVLKEGMTPLRYSKRVFRYLRKSMDRSYRPDSWFKIDPRVEMRWRPSLHSFFVPDADAVVATFWRTAEWVANYPVCKGEKYYLIQHQETWAGPESRVMATWRLPLHKIVIARWLQAIADDMGEKSTYIPNGMDLEAFGMDSDPEKRNPNRVMMLYHQSDWKGSADGLKALQIAHENFPALEADFFGVPVAPDDLPPWIRYHRNPPQTKLRGLYNEAAIFLAPSWTEGWGLTPAEAMVCGAAVVATNIGGHREFCVPDQTALLSPPKEPNAMAQNLLTLLHDQEKRIRIARSGNEYIQQFTWSRATNALESALLRKDFAR